MTGIHVQSDLILELGRINSLSSYRQILTALDEAQVTLRTVADTTQHFLHKTLLEIATRLRGSHTMTTNTTMTQLIQGYPENTASATESNRTELQNEISPEMLAEIAQTQVTKAQPENQKTFKPRPAFMHTETEELEHQKVFNPKPGSR